jgi:hypothetical protein
MINFGQVTKKWEAKFNSDVSLAEFDVPDADQAVSIRRHHQITLEAIASNILVGLSLGNHLGCVQNMIF